MRSVEVHEALWALEGRSDCQESPESVVSTDYQQEAFDATWPKIR